MSEASASADVVSQGDYEESPMGSQKVSGSVSDSGLQEQHIDEEDEDTKHSHQSDKKEEHNDGIKKEEEEEEEHSFETEDSGTVGSDLVSFIDEKSRYSRKPRNVIATVPGCVFDFLLFEPPAEPDSDLPVLLLTHSVFVNASIYGTALPNLLAAHGFVTFVLNSLGHGHSAIPSLVQKRAKKSQGCCGKPTRKPVKYKVEDIKMFFHAAIEYVKKAAKDISNGEVAVLTHGSSDLVIQSLLIDELNSNKKDMNEMGEEMREEKQEEEEEESTEIKESKHTSANNKHPLGISKVVRFAPFDKSTLKRVFKWASTNDNLKAKRQGRTLHLITDTSKYRSKALGKASSPYVKGIPTYAYALLGPNSPVDSLLITEYALGDEPYSLIKGLSQIESIYEHSKYCPTLSGDIYKHTGIKNLTIFGKEDAFVPSSSVVSAFTGIEPQSPTDVVKDPEEAVLVAVPDAGHLVQLCSAWSSIAHTVALWLSANQK